MTQHTAETTKDWIVLAAFQLLKRRSHKEITHTCITVTKECACMSHVKSFKPALAYQ